MLKRIVLFALAALLIVGTGGFAFYKLSPWPTVWLIRNSADEGAAQAQASVAAHIPPGIAAQRGLNYAPGDKDALLDVFAPSTAPGPLPAVVWVHGGGFISGSRSDLGGYLQVLASRGYVTVAVDYTTAPEAKFPTPVRQTNAALAYLLANAQRHNIDTRRIFLAGDSAGAQIAAQTALTISDPRYALQMGIRPGMARDSLRGLVLFCGPYDPRRLNWESPFAGFMRTVIWSYLGTKNPRDPRVARMAVPPHVTAAYPPAFISAGNGDPLAPQSVLLADALRAKGVDVDTLFFPKDYKPALPHEYQLLLSTKEGQLAFKRAAAFLAAHSQ